MKAFEIKFFGGKIQVYKGNNLADIINEIIEHNGDKFSIASIRTLREISK